MATLSETRFSKQGVLEEVGARYTFFWSGRPKAEQRDSGVALAIRNDIVGRLPCLPQGTSDRLMSLHLPLWGGNFAIITVLSGEECWVAIVSTPPMTVAWFSYQHFLPPSDAREGYLNAPSVATLPPAGQTFVRRRNQRDMLAKKAILGADGWTDHRFIISKVQNCLQSRRRPQDHQTEFFQDMWCPGEVLKHLKDATIIHLHVRKRQPPALGSRRGISLLNNTGKIFARTLLNRLNSHLEQGLLAERQCGFRRHRGTDNMTFAARRLQVELPEFADPLVPNLRRSDESLRHDRTHFELRISTTNVHELLFTDDCALNATTEGDMQMCIDLFAAVCDYFVSVINTETTVIMYRTQPDAAFFAPQINMKGVQLQAVDNFTYLGSTLSSTTKIDDEVARGIFEVSQAFGRLQSTVWNLSGLQLSTRLKMYAVISKMNRGTGAESFAEALCTSTASMIIPDEEVLFFPEKPEVVDWVLTERPPPNSALAQHTNGFSSAIRCFPNVTSSQTMPLKPLMESNVASAAVTTLTASSTGAQTVLENKENQFPETAPNTLPTDSSHAANTDVVPPPFSCHVECKPENTAQEKETPTEPGSAPENVLEVQNCIKMDPDSLPDYGHYKVLVPSPNRKSIRLRLKKIPANKEEVKTPGSAEATSPDQKATCKICHEDCGSFRGLRKHIRSRHPKLKEPTVCDICGDDCGTLKRLRAHVRSQHPVTKVHRCEVCNKEFSQECSLVYHLAFMHSRDSPYECQECHQKFVTDGWLRSHIEREHGSRTYPCNSCKYTFPTKVRLRMHVRRCHQGLKKIACDQCEKRFATSAGLDLHVKSIHEGLKPYECQVCQKRFTQPNVLKYHCVRFHAGMMHLILGRPSEEAPSTSL
nr:unnamed protein product [Spirometra erinaceieuropaei]